jgi:hypothetical protein
VSLPIRYPQAGAFALSTARTVAIAFAFAGGAAPEGDTPTQMSVRTAAATRLMPTMLGRAGGDLKPSASAGGGYACFDFASSSFWLFEGLSLTTT